MNMMIGHLTVAGLLIFSGLFIAATVVLGIVYAAVIAFSGGEFGLGFFKFMAVLFVVVVLALVFGLVDLPCGLSAIPALPNQWAGGCPIYTPQIPSVDHAIYLMLGFARP
ncbi:MAG TPA: hypothetical protein VIG30_06615 [Ktedonobacterales bacterium]|jgi:hypothetical protein